MELLGKNDDDNFEELMRQAAALIVKEELAKPADQRDAGKIDYFAQRANRSHKYPYSS